VEYFEDWFQYSDDDGTVGCHSVVSCFWLIFYHGVPDGSLSVSCADEASRVCVGDPPRQGVFSPVSNRGSNDQEYLKRVLFELSFFVWVGILLFNIITGLMVDTFSALREEAASREDTLTNECFICGFTRSLPRRCADAAACKLI
jgi:hypothetical protein